MDQPFEWRSPQPNSAVVAWLLASDPAIRWQTMRDLANAPAEDIAAERANVSTMGWGARLIASQTTSSHWKTGTSNPEWQSVQTLLLLRDMGLDPASEAAHRVVARVRNNVMWQGVLSHNAAWHGNPFFTGEAEPCINAKLVTAGAYFGQNVQHIVDRLLGEQTSDGGWNSERRRGATHGSFHTTIYVLEGLLEHERATGGSPAEIVARKRGQAYLLENHLFHHSTSDVNDTERLQRSFSAFYRYNMLRGLDYLRSAAVAPDARVAEALALVVSKRDADGRWPLEHALPDQVDAEPGVSKGQPSRWNTLRALRVLKWFSASNA